MGKVVYSMSVSLDGFAAGPNGELDWAIIDEELHRFFNEEARQTSVELYGRRMYELMTSYWPTAEDDPSAPDYVVEFARIWKATPKIVFSKTLDRVEWNSTLARDIVADDVAGLKSKYDGDLSVAGPNLAGSLIELGLVDEYRLTVHPVVIGHGIPFFPAVSKPINLRLVESQTFGSGAVHVRYENRRD